MSTLTLMYDRHHPKANVCRPHPMFADLVYQLFSQRTFDITGSPLLRCLVLNIALACACLCWTTLKSLAVSITIKSGRVAIDSVTIFQIRVNEYSDS